MLKLDSMRKKKKVIIIIIIKEICAAHHLHEHDTLHKLHVCTKANTVTKRRLKHANQH